MKILILGGTADARRITGSLMHAQMRGNTALSLTYSVAGLVRQPQLDCPVISGGFRQFGGLTHYLRAQGYQGVIDATHPYAAVMTATAQQSCAELGLAYWRFSRAPWCAIAGDHWQELPSWSALISALQGYRRPFLTTGQLSQDLLEKVAVNSEQLLYRTAAPSRAQLPENCEWIKGIGPFQSDEEIEIMRQYSIDVVVSKNAGGEATYGKLEAARALGISVLMLARPPLAVSALASSQQWFFEDIDGLNRQVMQRAQGEGSAEM